MKIITELETLHNSLIQFLVQILKNGGAASRRFSAIREKQVVGQILSPLSSARINPRPAARFLA